MPIPKETIATIIPTMRYHDAESALAWLCDAFGFTRHLIISDGAGGIAHAQLRLCNGMIMLASARNDEFGQWQHPPTTPVVTQSPYLVVGDIDAHYANAVAAGAVITIEIKDEEYGGRSYTCRDPEGHLWSFGSYDPWQHNPVPSTPHEPSSQRQDCSSRKSNQAVDSELPYSGC